MFNSIGWAELLLLLAVGLIVLGPERLPAYVADGVRLLRRLRELSTTLTSELREQLGPDLAALTTTAAPATAAASTAGDATAGATDLYQHVPRHPMFDELPDFAPPSESPPVPGTGTGTGTDTGTGTEHATRRVA